MIRIFCVTLAATASWVVMAVPLSAKTTTPEENTTTSAFGKDAGGGPATRQDEAIPPTLRKSSNSHLHDRAPSQIDLLNVMNSQTSNFSQKPTAASELMVQLSRELNGNNTLEGKTNINGNEIGDQNFWQVTEVEVIILESGENVEDLAADIQKRYFVTNKSAESEHVVQYFTNIEDLPPQEAKGPGPSDTADPEEVTEERPTLILLGNHIVQMQQNLDDLSPPEGNEEERQVWPLMAGVALVAACVLLSCLAFFCLWRWMKVLNKRDLKGDSSGEKTVLTWTSTSNHYRFPQEESLYSPSSNILSRELSGYKGVAVVGLISPAPKRAAKLSAPRSRRSSSDSPTRRLLQSSTDYRYEGFSWK